MDVRPGYKRTEAGVVPEDWAAFELDDMCDRISVGLATSVTQHYRPSGVPIIRNQNIKNGYFDGRDMLFVSQNFAKANASKSARALDVLTVHTGANLGDACVLPSAFDNCQTFTTLITTPKRNVLNPHYLCLHMCSENGKAEMSRLQVGGGKGNLNTNDLKQYRIAVPLLAEQEVIAQALSDADALIGSLEQLLAKKRQIKQGAMHELLTGKKRLPGFSAAWMVKLFGEVASPRRDRVNPGRTGPYEFCIELEHIEPGTGCLSGNSTTSEGSSLKSVFRKDDVLFGKLRAYLRKYWLAMREGVCSTEIWVLTARTELLTPEFLFQLVTADRFIETASSAYGTHMPRSDWNVVKNYDVRLPLVPEQTAIAAVLSDMDAEIAAVHAKIAKARSIKQGMMQELLTGRIRLV